LYRVVAEAVEVRTRGPLVKTTAAVVHETGKPLEVEELASHNIRGVITHSHH